MRFSEVFGISRRPDDDWFDPILGYDTGVFIDPFLVYAHETPEFVGSHADILRYFHYVLGSVARARGHPDDPGYQEAVSLLHFGEARELCLGYTMLGTRGSGMGAGCARDTAAAAWELVRSSQGERVSHFEELSLLRPGIGADRVSDMTAKLLWWRLGLYTERVCARHKVAGSLTELDCRKAPDMPRPPRRSFRLPTNPESGRPVLLVPERYLRRLPTINPDDFWGYCFENHNQALRDKFGDDVKQHALARDDVVRLARDEPRLRAAFIASRESTPPSPYDMSADPEGVIKWYDTTADHCRRHPLQLPVPTDPAQLESVLEAIVESFRAFIEDPEDPSGCNLLWTDRGVARGGGAARLAFLGVVKHHCDANGLKVGPLGAVGQGVVTLTAQDAPSHRVLLWVAPVGETALWAPNRVLQGSGPNTLATAVLVAVQRTAADDAEPARRRVENAAEAVRLALGAPPILRVVDAWRG